MRRTAKSSYADEMVVAFHAVEDKAWPFVISVVSPDASAAFFERYFVKIIEIAERRQPWVHLVDIRQVVKLPDARVRNLLAENSKKLDPLSAKYNMGTATIISSTLARGVLTAIHWINPPAYPWLVPATPEEGVEYLRGQLIKAGMPVPAQMSATLVEIVAQRVAREFTAREASR
jgi:hypothetical protein